MIITIISVLYSLVSLGQDSTRAEDVIILPASIVKQMFKDVKERDQLRYELNKKDSTIRVYEVKELAYKEEISALKLSSDNYEKIVANMEAVAATREAQHENELNTARRYGRKVTIIVVVELVLLLIALL